MKGVIVDTYANVYSRQAQTRDQYVLVGDEFTDMVPVDQLGLTAVELCWTLGDGYYAQPPQPLDGQITYAFGGSFVWVDHPEFPGTQPIPLHDKATKTRSY